MEGEIAIAVMLGEVQNSLQRLVHLLHEDRKLLREILERLPKPVYPQTTGLSITVRN